MVGSSAIDRGDGSWLVSAYARDEAAIGRLRERGSSFTGSREPSRSGESGRPRPPRRWAISARVRCLSVCSDSRAAIGRVHDRGASPSHARATRRDHAAHRDRFNSDSRRARRRSRARVGAAGRVALVRRGLVGAYARNGSMDHAEWIDDTARPPIPYSASSVRPPTSSGHRWRHAGARAAGQPRRARLHARGRGRTALHVAQESPPAAGGSHWAVVYGSRSQSELRHRLGLRALLQHRLPPRRCDPARTPAIPRWTTAPRPPPSPRRATCNRS